MAILNLFRKRWVQLALALVLLLLFLLWLTPSKEHIKGSHFVIAKDPAWPQVELLDKENLIAAFTDEFMRTFAKKGEFSITIVDTSADRLLTGLRDKTFDAILIPVMEKPSMSMRDLIFSQPYFALGPVLVLKKNSPDMNAETIQTKRIGIEQGSAILTHLYKYPGLDVQILKNYFVGLESLVDNRIDALIIDALPAFLQLESRYKDQFRIQSPALTKGGLKLLTQHTMRGDSLIEAFNATLKTSFENGEYQNLLGRWGFTGYPQPLFKTPKEETADEEDDI